MPVGPFKSRPARQQQRAKDVRRFLDTAQQQAAQGFPSVAPPEVTQGVEYRQCAQAFIVQVLRPPQILFQCLPQALQPARGRIPLPGVERLPQNAPQHHGPLAKFDRQQVEAEGFHAPDQPLHTLASGEHAAVLDKAVGQHFEIVQQLVLVVIVKGAVRGRSLKASRHQQEEQTKRHVALVRP